MQTIEIKDLDVYQQEKLKPIIEYQKRNELNHTKETLKIVKIIYLPFLIGIPIFYIPELISFIGHPNFSSMFLLSTLIFGSIYLFFFMYIKHLELTIARKEKDNFFILYGYVEDIDMRIIDHNDGTRDYEYYYDIENIDFKINTQFFKNFDYHSMPIKCHRYFLLRDQEREIKQDLTEYFK